MSTIIVYQGSVPWRYFIQDFILGNFEEVTEQEFFKDFAEGGVGLDRFLVPMEYEKGNVNRQNFLLNGRIIGYRIRELG